MDVDGAAALLTTLAFKEVGGWAVEILVLKPRRVAVVISRGAGPDASTLTHARVCIGNEYVP